MNDTLKTIHDVDLAFLAVERARMAVDAAKMALDLAKQDAEAARVRLEESLAKAEELGLPKAKLRKVAEERVTALLASGLIKDDAPTVEKAATKNAKAPRRTKVVDTEPHEKATDETNMIQNALLDSPAGTRPKSIEENFAEDQSRAETLEEANV